MLLVVPALPYLDSYKAALQRGWSPDTIRVIEAPQEELAAIADGAAAFVASLSDPEGKGPPIEVLGGGTVARLPSYRRWMWDGEFCGSVNFRWQAGSSALPPHCLGHIGYTVVPWKRRRGYATRALAMIMPEARKLGLAYLELTTDLDNIPSQKVITANGGTLISRFTKEAHHGGTESLLFRIPLMPAT